MILRTQQFSWCLEMGLDDQAYRPVRAGDLDGLRRTYSDTGGLITETNEEILKAVTGWDMNVLSPWRRFLPKFVFMGFAGRASSKLFVTNKRIVLVRDIDPWRELKGELTPLGVPTAAAKEVRLKKLKSLGARQYCEIRPRDFNVVKKRSFDRRESWIDLRLVGTDGKQYAVTIWKTDGPDQETRTLIESQFSR
ncbi:MAG TPA: hypothetical protein VF992_08970 [Thermoplasmata archaeon]